MFVTRKADAPPVQVAYPRRESLVLLTYLAVYALILFRLLLQIVKDDFEPGRMQQAVVDAYKLTRTAHR